jgi:hypothetical protein
MKGVAKDPENDRRKGAGRHAMNKLAKHSPKRARPILISLLRQTGGCSRAVARVLGIHRQSLWRWMRACEIKPMDYRREPGAKRFFLRAWLTDKDLTKAIREADEKWAKECASHQVDATSANNG